MDDEIKIKHYTIKKSEYIGKGYYGSVYGCYSDLHKDKKLCAKVLRCWTDQQPNEIVQATFYFFDNPHLIKIYDLIKQGKYYYIIMEKCTGSDLKSLLEDMRANKKEFSLQQIVEIAKQFVLGYQSLFSKKVLHKNIKPATILLSSEYEGELFIKVLSSNSFQFFKLSILFIKYFSQIVLGS